MEIHAISINGIHASEIGDLKSITMTCFTHLPFKTRQTKSIDFLVMKQILCASTLQISVLEFKTYFNLRNCCETGPGNDGLFAEIQTRSHTYHTKLSRMCFRILILLNCNFTHLRCLMIL